MGRLCRRRTPAIWYRPQTTRPPASSGKHDHPSPRRHTPHSSNPPAPPPEHNADTEDHQQPEQPVKDQSQITAENERPREALSLRLLFPL